MDGTGWLTGSEIIPAVAHAAHPGEPGEPGNWHASVPAGGQNAFLLASVVEAERDARIARRARNQTPGLTPGQLAGLAAGLDQAVQHARAVTDHAWRTWPRSGRHDANLHAHLKDAIGYWRDYLHLSIPQSLAIGRWADKLRQYGRDAGWAGPSLSAMGFPWLSGQRGAAAACRLGHRGEPGE